MRDNYAIQLHIAQDHNAVLWPIFSCCDVDVRPSVTGSRGRKILSR